MTSRIPYIIQKVNHSVAKLNDTLSFRLAEGEYMNLWPRETHSGHPRSQLDNIARLSLHSTSNLNA